MKTILIAEDNPSLSQMYAAYLRSLGYEVEAAVNGEEALQKLEAAKELPALIILDVMMPKLNGLEVLRGIKEDARFRSIPVLMLTSLEGRESEGEHAIAAGASAYLAKGSTSLLELGQQVKKFLA